MGFFVCLFFNSLDIADLLEGFEARQWHSYCCAWDFPPGENISALMACTVVDRGLWWEPQPSPIFLPGKPHGQGSLASYSSWDCKETRLSDSYFHFSFIEIEYYTCQATFSCSLKNAAGLYSGHQCPPAIGRVMFFLILPTWQFLLPFTFLSKSWQWALLLMGKFQSWL